MRLRLLGLVLALALVAAPASLARADVDDLIRFAVPDGLHGWDGWYGIYLGGNKCGWGHETYRRVGTGKASLWVIRLDAHMEVKVMGQTGVIAFGEMVVFDGSAPYAFRRGVSYHDDGTNRRVIRVAGGPQGLRAQIIEGGETRVRETEGVDYTLSDYMTPLAWMAKDPHVGDSIRVRHLSLDDVAGDVTTCTIAARAKEVLEGVEVEIFDVAAVSDREGDSGTSRVDARGKVLSMSMGGFFELRLEPEALARKIEAGGDLFMQGTVKIDQPLGDAPQVRRLVLEVQGEGLEELADAPRQRVVRDGDTVLLELGDVHPDGFPASEEEIARSLSEETEYPILHPAVIALAKRAIGDAQTDREKVERLVPFVGEYVVDEMLANSLNVMEMLKTPRGDCTEHALLMTALARAVGIPAREISGLMYMGNKYRAFGGHAWTEVVLDGKWVAVDPAWNQMELDATHVTLSRTEKDQMRMMRLYGKIAFVKKEIERAE